jgi:hypothetical protein
MREVVKEMHYQVPETFLGFNIFLAAMMAIRAYYFSSTIQTVGFCALGKVRQL